MLSSLFCTLHVAPAVLPSNQQQPILLIVQNTMPLYTQIATKYYANSEIMDVLSALLKHTVTTLLDDSRPLIPDLLQLVVTAYVQSPQASVLNLAKTVCFIILSFISFIQQNMLESGMSVSIQ